MPATIRRLVTKRDRLRSDEAERVRTALSEAAEQFALPLPALRGIYEALDRQTFSSSKWTFVMLSPSQNNAVVQWLVAHSVRPLVAVRLWAITFAHLDRDTGQIMLTRDELAELLQDTPAHVSTLMSELEHIKAVIRRRQPVPGMKGRGVAHYFLNPQVGTHLTGAARDAAQAEAPTLFPIMEGGKAANPSR